MNETAYKVETDYGFYYTTGNGRYGRINGVEIYEAMCKEHAQAVAEFFEQEHAEIIPINAAPFAIPCAKCKREKRGR